MRSPAQDRLQSVKTSREVILNRHIFRQYDIRGVAYEELTPEIAEAIGAAIGTMIRRKRGSRMAVGRDCRVSSDELKDALLAGLVSAGITVTDIGLSTTPLLYYSVFTLDVDGGVMVTGSHNPPDMNGFKIMLGKDTIHGEQIQDIVRLIEAEDFESGEGSVAAHDVKPAYWKDLSQRARIRPGLKVGVDFGNGTGAITTLALLDQAGCEIHPLYAEPDGSFPNHHPDPTVVSNLQALQQLVTSRHLDLGVAYDGDADRLGVVDNRGQVIFGDMLMVLYSRHILARNPDAAIIGEVKCSQRMYNDIAAHGGRPVMWKTGHSLIKEKLKTEDALLAGEMSGHIFFRDRYYGFDDACYATLRLLEILSEKEDVPLSEMLTDLPPAVSTPEIRVECPDDIKFGIVDRAIRHFSSIYETITVDGVRILFEKGWGLIRVSNTQPVIVVRFEAESNSLLAAYRKEVEEFLGKEGLSLPGPE